MTTRKTKKKKKSNEDQQQEEEEEEEGGQRASPSILHFGPRHCGRWKEGKEGLYEQ